MPRVAPRWRFAQSNPRADPQSCTTQTTFDETPRAARAASRNSRCSTKRYRPRPGVVELLGVAHADEVGGDAAPERRHVGHDVAPEVRRGRVAVQEDDGVAPARLDVGHALAEHLDGPLRRRRVRDHESIVAAPVADPALSAGGGRGSTRAPSGRGGPCPRAPPRAWQRGQHATGPVRPRTATQRTTGSIRRADRARAPADCEQQSARTTEIRSPVRGRGRSGRRCPCPSGTAVDRRLDNLRPHG